MAKESVSKDVLLDGAQMNLSALIAGTMGFLKKKRIPIKDWVKYIGDEFEGSWGALEGEKLQNVLGHLLTLEILPLGVEAKTSEITPKKAEVTVTTLPSRIVLKKFGTTPKELLDGFGVTAEEMASFYAMYEPAAKAIGLKFTHRLSGGRQLLAIERQPTKTSNGHKQKAKARR
jgi:hypothetical protein